MTVYVHGDIHGSALEVKSCLSQIKNPRANDVIVVCGDAGLEYGDSVQGSAKKAMKKFPGRWLVLRGNHDTRYWRDHADDTEKWHVETMFGNETLVQNKYPNIHYAKDEGGIYTLQGCGNENNGVKCLFVPGAYSVDKFYRLRNHYPYEYEEQLDYKEFSNLYDMAIESKDEIDFVFAHTFPLKMEGKLSYLFMDGIDQSEVSKNSEKWLDTIMGTIENGKRFKHYFGGHYHDDRELDGKYTLLYHNTVELEDYIG